MNIPIKVIIGDALTINTDVLVLKFAQGLFGVDLIVTERLNKIHSNLTKLLPETGNFLQIDTYGSLGAKEVLYVGVEPLSVFRYQNIREFSHRAMAFLADESPESETVCFTLHGGGYGLDEIEAFESELAGIVDALSKSEFPHNLKQIIIVEIKENLANRLDQALKKLFPLGCVVINNDFPERNSSSEWLNNVGHLSETKPLVFVAMPFDKKMYDVYYYGIRGAVNKAGYLCERADEAYFSGEVIEWVKLRIRQADLVLADLSQANANVYLEVGYAWGNNKKTILLANDVNALKFDVKGQRCLIYNGIKELEELLQKELKQIPLLNR